MSISVLGRSSAFLIKSTSPALLKWSPLCQQQVAGIMNKVLRDMDTTRPLPYPYREKTYNLWRSVFDKTSWRLDENSKIIVVDGPVAAGKEELAKELAAKLDMAYMPHASLDRWYINPYGFDLRTIDDIVPESCRSFDINNFLADPYDYKVASMQNLMMTVRVYQYIDALAHVLSTGQGVVMNRSIWSDCVFVDTLAKHGMISKAQHRYYYVNMDMVMYQLFQPHLIIYLDVPVDECIKRANARNRPGEMNSPFYKPEILATMEDNYKNQFLKRISKHAEVLIYDWSEKGDPEVVVEDCERVELDDYDEHDGKMHDWRQDDENAWNIQRMNFTCYREKIEGNLNWVPVFDCPELQPPGEDMAEYRGIIQNCPGYKYQRGFNAEEGDTNILFKRHGPKNLFNVGGVYSA